MGKRSEFPRNANDLYPTPYEAVLPLIPWLRGVRSFAEPCCGNHDLVRHLRSRPPALCLRGRSRRRPGRHATRRLRRARRHHHESAVDALGPASTDQAFRPDCPDLVADRSELVWHQASDSVPHVLHRHPADRAANLDARDEHTRKG